MGALGESNMGPAIMVQSVIRATQRNSMFGNLSPGWEVTIPFAKVKLQASCQEWPGKLVKPGNGCNVLIENMMYHRHSFRDLLTFNERCCRRFTKGVVLKSSRNDVKGLVRKVES
jgi:hypothetical protein